MIRKNPKITVALLFLAVLHLAILFAGFVAPQDPSTQNREFSFVPPSHLRFVDAHGHLHLRPFIYQWGARPDGLHGYAESREREYPVRFFVRGPQYKIAGLFESHTHLFGVDAPALIFLAGTDNYGRDQFSRILYGGQVSLAAGVLAAGTSLLLGSLVGCISGFYGKWIDESAM
ncbi:MAG TPA: hypothetical protein VGN39_02180, partial [Terriglobales bacterium]|nr:hypothetical protein [Terriglobales bacterium]